VKVVSIFDLEQDLFNWLAFLDINVIIILVLMLLIGIINMGSALLVLIIIRSNFIGLMKAMGGSNRQLRRIFLIQAAYLVGSGMFIGNIAGLALYALQRFTGMLTLNPEVYYLDRVPVELTLNSFLLLNLGSFVVCMTALLLPSALIARVNPVKTIKFN
jgi:lipoprotein-releasing system permease protein